MREQKKATGEAGSPSENTGTKAEVGEQQERRNAAQGSRTGDESDREEETRPAKNEMRERQG
jgi:hypothetical protein